MAGQQEKEARRVVRASYDAHLGRWGTRERAPMWRAYAHPVKPQFRTSVKFNRFGPAARVAGRPLVFVVSIVGRKTGVRNQPGNAMIYEKSRRTPSPPAKPLIFQEFLSEGRTSETAEQISPSHACHNDGLKTMATIRKRGTSWQVQVRRRGCPPLNRTFGSRSDAITWARDKERAINRAELPLSQRELRAVTVGDLLDRYEREITSSKRGADRERFKLRVLRAPSHRQGVLDRLSQCDGGPLPG